MNSIKTLKNKKTSDPPGTFDAYFDMMPKEITDFPLTWDEIQLGELKGSLVPVKEIR